MIIPRHCTSHQNHPTVPDRPTWGQRKMQIPSQMHWKRRLWDLVACKLTLIRRLQQEIVLSLRGIVCKNYRLNRCYKIKHAEKTQSVIFLEFIQVFAPLCCANMPWGKRNIWCTVRTTTRWIKDIAGNFFSGRELWCAWRGSVTHLLRGIMKEFEITEELAAMNDRDYCSEWFVHAGKYMLGKASDEMGQIGKCCNQWLPKGKNAGFWKQMQDKVREINS